MDSSELKVPAGFANRCILVLGDVMLDEYYWGDVRRISPEAPVPVVEVRSRTYRLGGAANVAANVASLGARAFLAGVVGCDAHADRLRTAMAECGLPDTGILADAGRPTTTKTRVLALHQHQQVVRIDSEERRPLSDGLEQELLAWTEQHLPRAHACVLSDYGKGVVSARLARQIIQQARAAGKPIIVDPKCGDYTMYRGATVIKPNVHEAGQFLGYAIETPTMLLEAGAQLASRLEGTAVLITRGAEGMSLFRAGLPVVHVAPAARSVFDVTGAGDTVVGLLALALAAGKVPEEAIELASRAAGVVVGKVGTAVATWEELSEHACP
jgi:rfaE bifunctional protein kinase chain/domain